MYVRMYVYMYVRMYVYMYVCIYVYIYTIYVRMYVSVFACMYVRMYVCMCFVFDRNRKGRNCIVKSGRDKNYMDEINWYYGTQTRCNLL